MSLKRKNELAMLAFLKASGLFDADPDENGNPQYTVQFLTSQENQETNLSPPAVVAVWQRLKEFTDPKGRGTGRIIGRMDLLTYGKADKQKNAATNPEDDHAAIVGLVESCFQIHDLADQLSSQVSDYHCFYAHPRTPANVQPSKNHFVDSLAWETASCDTDC